MRRIFYIALGWASFSLGVIGVVLPVLPTTPFMLVAAFAFSKGSPRVRMWLMNHQRFGPPIRDWETRGAISRRAKIMGVGAMVLVFTISLIMALPVWVLALQAVSLTAAATFILTRPD